MKKTTLLWMLLAALGACNKPTDPTPPGNELQAAFLVTNAGSITAGCQPALFENHSENAESYQWDFGDGTQSTEANPQHIYANAGTYTVVLNALTGTSTSKDTSTVTVDYITSFSRLYPNYSRTCKMAKTPDGGYVVVRSSAATVVVGLVTKFKANGDVQWEIQLDPSNILHGADDVVVTPDGSIYVVGFSDINAGDENIEATIWRLTPNGDIVWVKRIGGLFEQYFTTIAVLDDGSFWAGGSTFFLNSFYLGYLAGFDANGNLLFETTTGTGVQGSWISSIIPSEDGHVLVGGSGYPGIDPGLNEEIWVNKLNRANRSLMWSKTYGQTPSNESVAEIIRTNDHQFALIGSNGGYGILFLKIDANGNLLAQRNLTNEGTGRSLAELPDGTITVSGNINLNWYLANYNASGSALNWQSEKDNMQGNFDAAFDFEQTPDGGYFVCGRSGFATIAQQLWMVKTDCSGN